MLFLEDRAVDWSFTEQQTLLADPNSATEASVMVMKATVPANAYINDRQLIKVC